MTYRARAYFLTAREGGFQQPLHDSVRIPMKIGGEFLDCVITLSGPGPFALGTEYPVTVEFLSPDLAEEVIARHRDFELWAGKVIGRGQIIGTTGDAVEG
jgi:hypothetical protein